MDSGSLGRMGQAEEELRDEQQSSGATEAPDRRRWHMLAVGVAFAVLAIGPALGSLAMWRLRSLPEARRLAGGRR